MASTVDLPRLTRILLRESAERVNTSADSDKPILGGPLDARHKNLAFLVKYQNLEIRLDHLGVLQEWLGTKPIIPAVSISTQHSRPIASQESSALQTPKPQLATQLFFQNMKTVMTTTKSSNFLTRDFPNSRKHFQSTLGRLSPQALLPILLYFSEPILSLFSTLYPRSQL